MSPIRPLTVVLDSNVYCQDFTLKRALFSSFADFLRVSQSTLILHELVYEEVTAVYRRQLQERMKTLRNAEEAISFMVSEPHLRHPIDVEAECSKLQRRMKRPAPGVIAKPVRYEHADLPEVARRAIHRIAPASPKGEELRDVILWTMVLGMAKQQAAEMAFVTNDVRGFWSEGSPNDQIKSDLGQVPNLSIYPTLREFLTAHALQARVVKEMSNYTWFEEIPVVNLLFSSFHRVTDTMEFSGSRVSRLDDYCMERAVAYDLEPGHEYIELLYSSQHHQELRHWDLAIDGWEYPPMSLVTRDGKWVYAAHDVTVKTIIGIRCVAGQDVDYDLVHSEITSVAPAKSLEILIPKRRRSAAKSAAKKG